VTIAHRERLGALRIIQLAQCDGNELQSLVSVSGETVSLTALDSANIAKSGAPLLPGRGFLSTQSCARRRGARRLPPVQHRRRPGLASGYSGGLTVNRRRPLAGADEWMAALTTSHGMSAILEEPTKSTKE
jgi:hypothetical protein